MDLKPEGEGPSLKKRERELLRGNGPWPIKSWPKAKAHTLLSPKFLSSSCWSFSHVNHSFGSLSISFKTEREPSTCQFLIPLLLCLCLKKRKKNAYFKVVNLNFISIFFSLYFIICKKLSGVFFFFADNPCLHMCHGVMLSPTNFLS